MDYISEQEMQFIEACIDDKPASIYEKLSAAKEDIDWYITITKALIDEVRRLRKKTKEQ